MKRIECVKAFLNKYTHQDLSELYHGGMECQVNVAQDGGDPIEGEYLGRRWRGWTKNGETWKSFRIPFNANIDPSYNDSEINFDFEAHVDGIGMTGWDWISRKSFWVAFDFDAVTGHSEKHAKKLTDTELQQVRESISNIPWVTIRRSTGGKGLHLYVFLDAVATSNHTEHAALARAILSQISGLAGIDLKSKVDVCGGNMWVWHRKMKGTNGLELLKRGEILDEIPEYWKDHLKVIKGERSKVVPFFLGESKNLDDFEQLTGQRAIVPLDSEHNRVLTWLRENGGTGSSWWDADHHMLITHTSLLKECHESLSLRGRFDTISTGRDRGNDHNVYLFPLRRGAWTVRRYTQGIQEHPSWEQDGQGWTRCFFNKEPDLESASRAFGGKERSSGGFVFNTAEEAQKATQLLGVDLNLPNFLTTRRTTLKKHPKDGRLIAVVDKTPNDPADQKLESWLADKSSWQKIFSTKVVSPNETETDNLDSIIRHMVTDSGTDAGWVVLSDNEWRDEPLSHVRPGLIALGYKKPEVDAIVGSAIFKPWRIVNKPFQEEYPGDREWNRNAAQLRYRPVQEETLNHTHWNKILEHCGSGLDSAIKDHPWAKVNGIKSGADYLKVWIASVFKEPTEPLPYLFFYSREQNTGKSIFHEALALLVTSGYIRADNALISQGGFNAELYNAVFCVIEETDLRKDRNALNRIKDWVTSRQLSIHAKGRTPFQITNTTHWIQCSNNNQACPVFPGDTRIVMVNVPEIGPLDLIPKKQLIFNLEKEASHFITSVLNLEIPPSNDRLNVPVIATSEKIQTERANRTMLEMFLEECCFQVNGSVMRLTELYDRFRDWLDPSQYQYWTKIRMGRELPPEFPKGSIHSDPNTFIGNISFEARKPDEPIKPKLVLQGKFLEPSNTI